MVIFTIFCSTFRILVTLTKKGKLILLLFHIWFKHNNSSWAPCFVHSPYTNLDLIKSMFIVKTTTGSQEYGDKLSELLYVKDIKSAYIFWFSDKLIVCQSMMKTKNHFVLINMLQFIHFRHKIFLILFWILIQFNF